MQLIVHATNRIELPVRRMQSLVFQIGILVLRFHQSAIDDTLKCPLLNVLVPGRCLFSF